MSIWNIYNRAKHLKNLPLHPFHPRGIFQIHAEIRCLQKQRVAVEDELVRTDQAILHKSQKLAELK